MTPEFELLRQASNEIKQLRTQNNLMAARLDTFDKCVALLTANVQGNSMGMSPDIVWEIDDAIENENERQRQNPM